MSNVEAVTIVRCRPRTVNLPEGDIPQIDLDSGQLATVGFIQPAAFHSPLSSRNRQSEFDGPVVGCVEDGLTGHSSLNAERSLGGGDLFLKSSKRLERKLLDYGQRPYKNSLAAASFILNPDFARAAAQTLHGQSDYDRAIKKAFDTFKLDPTQPHHWLELLGILADILFGERGKGPKQRWNPEAIKKLRSYFDDLSSNYPDARQILLFELLTYTKRPYRGLQAATLKAKYNEEKRRLGMTRRGRRKKL